MQDTIVMKNILLLNGGKAFAHSHGRLNDTLHDAALAVLSNAGFSTRQTKIDAGYDIQAEVENIHWADLVIYQMPGWWMDLPWTVKRYVDEVFTAGHGTLYANDGRSRSHPERKYGSGGLLQGKHYMLSLTWNAPEEAFVDPDQFFEGKGIDAVYFPFHKANQFLGMTPLPTYLATNVIKEPHVEQTIVRYRAHLADVLGFEAPKTGVAS
ncbi:oxidoreductase [Acetobacter aceti NRIC 0242]|nr:oxidoreductase [Acetobacter aceti NRIC 0242]